MENESKKQKENTSSCRCSYIKEISIKRVKELEGLKKYARDQFSVGIIESQIKYWKELQ